MHVADQAVRAAPDRRAVKAVAELSRVVAPDQDVPGLGIALVVAQRRERDAELRAPALVVDLRRGVVVVVGREVLVEIRVVEDAVRLNATWIYADLDRRA